MCFKLCHTVSDVLLTMLTKPVLMFCTNVESDTRMPVITAPMATTDYVLGRCSPELVGVPGTVDAPP